MQTMLICTTDIFARLVCTSADPGLHRSQASMRDTRRSTTDYRYGGSFTMHCT